MAGRRAGPRVHRMRFLGPVDSRWRNGIAKLEALTSGAVVSGLVSTGLATVVGAKWYGSDAIELTYKLADGSVRAEILYRDREPSLEIAEAGRPWSFDGDGSLFRLVAEAKRIDLAYLFDPFLAVTSASVEALPHQITASVSTPVSIPVDRSYSRLRRHPFGGNDDDLAAHS